MTKYLTSLEKSQKASYEMTYLIAKERKAYTIRETLIKHATIATSQIMNVNNLTEEMKGILISAETLCQCISEMGKTFKCQLNDRVKSEKYAVQFDESLLCI